MKSISVLAAALLLCLLGSSCEICEMCTRTVEITKDGQLQSTSVTPYEYCGTRFDINQEERSSTSTTTRADGGTTVWTTNVVCD
ncbi:MAG: hypothetical protein AAFY36_08045 [Bacteroidota bacterium]